jgi:hypothetical protein
MPELNLSETWKVEIIESERGWGQKVEEVKFFDNQKDAVAFVNEFNSHNKADIVPDWYMYATRPVRIV